KRGRTTHGGTSGVQDDAGPGSCDAGRGTGCGDTFADGPAAGARGGVQDRGKPPGDGPLVSAASAVVKPDDARITAAAQGGRTLRSNEDKPVQAALSAENSGSGNVRHSSGGQPSCSHMDSLFHSLMNSAILPFSRRKMAAA